MDILIRRAALRATAKVALSLTVVGCGGSVAGAPDEGSASDDHRGPKADSYGEVSAGGSGGAGVGGAYAAADGGGRGSVDVDDYEEEALCAAPLPEMQQGEWTLELTPIELDGAQFACCAEGLPAFTASQFDDPETWVAQKDAADVQGCCNVIVQHIDADHSNTQDLDWSVTTACCDALGYPMGPACTPWGPPVPPDFDGELSAIWAVA